MRIWSAAVRKRMVICIATVVGWTIVVLLMMTIIAISMSEAAKIISMGRCITKPMYRGNL